MRILKAKKWNFTMIPSTKFKSLKQIAMSALLQSFKRVSRQTLHHLRVAAEANKIELTLGIVGLSYLIQVFFTLFEFDAEVMRKFHPFYDGMTYQNGYHWNGWVTMANFVYGLMEIVARVMIFLSASIAVLFGVKTCIFIVCAFVEVADIFDYWLTRNGPWFTVDKFLIFENWEFEHNYIKIFIVLSFCYTEWKRLKSPAY